MHRSALRTLCLVACTASACGPFAFVPAATNPPYGGLSIVNTSLNLEVGDVPMGPVGFAAAVTPDGFKVYLGRYGGCVAVFDTSDNTVSAGPCLFEAEAETAFNCGVAVHPSGNFAYVITVNGVVSPSQELLVVSTLSVLSTATDSEILRIPLGTVPYAVAGEGTDLLCGLDVAPDGSRVYFANPNWLNDDVVRIFDTATNTLSDEVVNVGVEPLGVAVTPDGARVYVTNSGENTVSVIATASLAVVATVPVGEAPRGIAIHPNGAFAYVANGGGARGGSVSVIETDTQTVLATVVLPGQSPVAIDVTPTKILSARGTFVYVAQLNGNTLSVIDAATNSVVDTVTLSGWGSLFLGKFIGPIIVPKFSARGANVRRLSLDLIARLDAAGGEPAEGKRFARRLITRHGRELHALLSGDPKLTREGFRLLGRFHGVLRDLIEGRPVRLGRRARREMGAWLAALRANATPALRESLTEVETALAAGVF